MNARRRTMYQNSMREMRAAADWWKAATGKEREESSTVQPLDWQFLIGMERQIVTMDLLNRGVIEADVLYESDCERRGYKLGDRVV